jgi:carotenoid cleavage dioxygenase-like enzyme
MFKVRYDLRLDSSTLNSIEGEYDPIYWSKAFRSQTEEFSYKIEKIDNSIPLSIQGTLFRNMPALFERGGVKFGHYLGQFIHYYYSN